MFRVTQVVELIDDQTMVGLSGKEKTYKKGERGVITDTDEDGNAISVLFRSDFWALSRNMDKGDGGFDDGAISVDLGLVDLPTYWFEPVYDTERNRRVALRKVSEHQRKLEELDRETPL